MMRSNHLLEWPLIPVPRQVGERDLVRSDMSDQGMRRSSSAGQIFVEEVQEGNESIGVDGDGVGEDGEGVELEYGNGGTGYRQPAVALIVDRIRSFRKNCRVRLLGDFETLSGGGVKI
jgi:hypothetical protein